MLGNFIIDNVLSERHFCGRFCSLGILIKWTCHYGEYSQVKVQENEKNLRPTTGVFLGKYVLYVLLNPIMSRELFETIAWFQYFNVVRVRL